MAPDTTKAPDNYPERIQAELDACLKAQTALTEQLTGINNQIYILEKLLKPPEPAPRTPSPEDALPKGTI